MKPINSKQNKEKCFRNVQQQDKRLQQVRADEARANNTNVLATTHNNAPVYSRELSLQSSTNDNFASQVTEAIKLYALEGIRLLNEVLVGSVAPSIQTSASDSIETLAFSACEGYSNISKNGLMHLYKEKLKEKGCTLSEILHNDIYRESNLNAYICWDTLVTLFQAYFNTEKDREVFLEFKSTQNSNDTMIDNVENIISDAILSIEKIKNECYFSIFRILIDPGLHLIFKYSKIGNHLVGKLDASNLLNEKILGQLMEASEEGIIKMASHVSKLQLLQDCLNTIKFLPKTVHNLEIAYKVLSNCHSFYKKDLESFKKISSKRRTPYCDDYYKVKSFLVDLAKKFATPINEAINKNNDLIAAARLQSSISNQKTENEAVTTRSNDGEQAISTEIEKSAPETAIPFPLKDHSVEIIGVKNVIERHEIDINHEPVTDIILDEADLNDIEPESNALMEVLRQLFDKDRAAKLKLKEEKLYKSKIVIEEEEGVASSDIKPKAVSQILSTTHQETIKALFKEKPDHLTIWGNDVKSLITALKGKSVGATGSQFNIFWNGSNKHAGEYEIAHGGDRKGYLTSKYAGRVADAIHIGIKNDWIERDLFPQELLMIIENYVISSQG